MGIDSPAVIGIAANFGMLILFRNHKTSVRDARMLVGYVASELIVEPWVMGPDKPTGNVKGAINPVLPDKTPQVVARCLAFLQDTRRQIGAVPV